MLPKEFFYSAHFYFWFGCKHLEFFDFDMIFSSALNRQKFFNWTKYGILITSAAHIGINALKNSLTSSILPSDLIFRHLFPLLPLLIGQFIIIVHHLSVSAVLILVSFRVQLFYEFDTLIQIDEQT